MGALLHWIRRKLWPVTEPESRAAHAALLVGRHVYALVRDFLSGELTLRAMSLVYTTMLAIVPALGFGFALAEMMGVYEQLRPLVFSTLEPIGERAEEVTNRIMSMIENVTGLGTVVGVVSVGVLIMTVISMAQKIETSFNFVWRVDQPRSFARRFSEYLSVILVGPLVMAVIATLIASLSSATLLDRLSAWGPVGSLIAYLGNTVPMLMAAASFAFLYMFIPNAKVNLKPALIGGLVGGAAWVASGNLFARLIATSATYLQLYSGFAIVLILMFWLYVSWLILLLGSQLAYYVQNPFHLRLGYRRAPIDNDERERLSLSVMYLIASDYASSAQGWTAQRLASTLRVGRDALDPIMAALSDAGLVAQTDEQRLLPGRDPHRIALADVLAAVRGSRRSSIEIGDAWSMQVDDIVNRLDDAIEAELGRQTLGQFVDANLKDSASHEAG